MWHHHGSDTPTSPGAILLHSSLLGGDRNMNNTVLEIHNFDGMLNSEQSIAKYCIDFTLNSHLENEGESFMDKD